MNAHLLVLLQKIEAVQFRLHGSLACGGNSSGTHGADGASNRENSGQFGLNPIQIQDSACFKLRGFNFLPQNRFTCQLNSMHRIITRASGIKTMGVCVLGIIASIPAKSAPIRHSTSKSGDDQCIFSLSIRKNPRISYPSIKTEREQVQGSVPMGIMTPNKCPPLSRYC